MELGVILRLVGILWQLMGSMAPYIRSFLKLFCSIILFANSFELKRASPASFTGGIAACPSGSLSSIARFQLSQKSQFKTDPDGLL